MGVLYGKDEQSQTEQRPAAAKGKESVFTDFPLLFFSELSVQHFRRYTCGRPVSSILK
jgi:hypothetical protein